MILSKYSKTFRNPSGIHLWSTGKNLQVLKVGNASKEEEEYKNPVFFVWKSMRIIWIRFLPLPDGHSAFQLTLQVLEAPLFPWASCRILIPLKSNCKSLMNYDLVSKIVCHCAIHLTHMMCLSIFGNDWWKTLFLISLCFFFNSFQYLSNNMFLTISRWLLENVVEEEESEDKNQQNDSKCCESRLVIQFQG